MTGQVAVLAVLPLVAGDAAGVPLPAWCTGTDTCYMVTIAPIQALTTLLAPSTEPSLVARQVAEGFAPTISAAAVPSEPVAFTIILALACVVTAKSVQSWRN